MQIFDNYQESLFRILPELVITRNRPLDNSRLSARYFGPLKLKSKILRLKKKLSYNRRHIKSPITSRKNVCQYFFFKLMFYWCHLAKYRVKQH